MLIFIAINVSSDNNLMYMFYTSSIAFSVDSTRPDILMECLSREFNKEYYEMNEIYKLPSNKKPRKLVYSFTTHHHSDHSSGDKTLKRLIPDIIQICDHEGIINIKDESKSFTVKCIRTPCHTRDSICILVDNKYLCTGDTVFYLGCGKFFEGTPLEMYENINKLKGLNNDLLVLYGHNYKESDIRFLKYKKFEYIDDERIFLKLKEEKKMNPFFTCTSPDELRRLREEKNSFVY